MLERYCDIIVIGTEIPGLITAAFLARRGLSVQVVETNPYAQNAEFPDPICETHLNSKLLRSILGRLNVPELSIQNFLGDETSSILQILFKNHRLDLLGDTSACLDEIGREFPNELKWWKDFFESMSRHRHQFDTHNLLQKVLPQSWGEKRQLKKFITESGFNTFFDTTTTKSQQPSIKAMLEALFLISNQSTQDKPFLFQMAEYFNPNDGAVFSVHAGMNDLKKILLDRIVHHQGSYRHKSFLKSMLYRNSVMEGVTLDDDQGQILSKYIVWNDSLTRLKPFLPKKWKFRSLIKQCDDVPTEFLCWFTARFKILAEQLPDPLKTNSLLIEDPKQSLEGANLVYLQVKRTEQESFATLEANFLLPQNALDWNFDEFEPYFNKIKSQISWLMPFGGETLVQEFPKQAAIDSSETLLPKSDDDFEMFKYSANENRVKKSSPAEVLDLFSLDYSTAVPNFYLSHPAVFGNLGMDADLMLGLKITDIIWHEVEKVKKRAMKAERRIA